MPNRAPIPRDQEGTEEGMPAAPRAEVQPFGRPRVAPPIVIGPWKLGVFAYNTDTGARITRVLPGSAASAIGLERGDSVVTVGGYQVGYVNGRLYLLGEELQRRADRNGRVMLLVQNWRNGELIAFPDARLTRVGP